METSKPISFGELLRTYRKRRGQTQQQLARKLDTHQNTIGAWERGDYLPATRGIILELGHCLHLDEAEARDLLEASLLTVTSRWSVPYQRNPFFTGRQAVLQQLHLLLSEEQQPPFSRSYALRGMGGVGKTQIAVEYVYRHVRDYNAIFWINTETEEDLLGSVVAMAAILKLPVPSIQERDVVLTLVLNWLQTHRDWLLLFDNVEDSAFIQRFVPAAHNGSFLMTTRLPTLGTLAPCLELQPLSQQESVQLLLSRAGVQPPHRPSIPLKEEEVEAVHAIAAAMDGLPLALDQAAAYIEESQCGFVEFLFLLRHHELQVLQTYPTSMAYPRSVERTFTLAF
ncbi:MAG TPA: helix-turn-helix domain-containing protein, partial [Ktedonobacteraceae bacterium]|nr:helix-turn-helix domain-containing protein [Ktedonobacteraceae bacterium]